MTKKAIKEASSQTLIAYLIETATCERVSLKCKWAQDAAAICAELSKRGAIDDALALFKVWRGAEQWKR